MVPEQHRPEQDQHHAALGHQAESDQRRAQDEPDHGPRRYFRTARAFRLQRLQQTLRFGGRQRSLGSVRLVVGDDLAAGRQMRQPVRLHRPCQLFALDLLDEGDEVAVRGLAGIDHRLLQARRCAIAATIVRA
jgi:hypothetical protein